MLALLFCPPAHLALGLSCHFISSTRTCMYACMQEFYKFATTKLSPGGVLVTQSGAAAVHLKDECFTVIHKTLKSVFEHVSMSVADVPSFGCCWGFNLASDSPSFSAEVGGVSLFCAFFYVRGSLVLV